MPVVIFSSSNNIRYQCGVRLPIVDWPFSARICKPAQARARNAARRSTAAHGQLPRKRKKHALGFIYFLLQHHSLSGLTEWTN